MQSVIPFSRQLQTRFFTFLYAVTTEVPSQARERLLVSIKPLEIVESINYVL